MLFPIFIATAIVVIAIYVIRNSKSSPATTVVDEPIASIHEEIVKTVEEAKSHLPIVVDIEDTPAPPAKKPNAPKMSAKPKTTTATTAKPKAKKKTVNA